MICTHEIWEKDTAIADGVCPLCQMAFCLEKTAEIEHLRAVNAELLAALRAIDNLAIQHERGAIGKTQIVARAAIAKAEGK